MNLIELVTCLTIIGILAGQAVVGAAGQADRAQAMIAHGALVNAYRMAQTTAIARREPVTVVLSGDSIVVRTADETLLRRMGPMSWGVAVIPASHDVTFGPSGLPLGVPNSTITITKGGVVRRLVISRLGRIRIP